MGVRKLNVLVTKGIANKVGYLLSNKVTLESLSVKYKPFASSENKTVKIFRVGKE